MSNDPKLNKLQTVSVFASNPTYERGKGTKQVTVHHPVGIGHLFELHVTVPGHPLGEKVKPIVTKHETSFCGLTHYQIRTMNNAKDWMETDKIMPYPICKTCQDIYKADPRSPWAKWETGTPLGNTLAEKIKVSKPKPKAKKSATKKTTKRKAVKK